MFNHVKSVGWVFSLRPKSSNLGLLGKLASLDAAFRTFILWR